MNQCQAQCRLRENALADTNTNYPTAVICTDSCELCRRIGNYTRAGELLNNCNLYQTNIEVHYISCK